ncbi:hypothetical protein TSAR_009779 [Trichomalopsis sarcophagae]|uniref:Uncharacterized protein n=1 Tax=Trichomalopsis sarcophagae TaxID=543379 RepID=A0A232F6E9_9HYME|nr:hypothetical protein TSAR_009779 [Trichomalopsis sarcophagae]
MTPVQQDSVNSALERVTSDNERPSIMMVLGCLIKSGDWKIVSHNINASKRRRQSSDGKVSPSAKRLCIRNVKETRAVHSVVDLINSDDDDIVICMHYFVCSSTKRDNCYKDTANISTYFDSKLFNVDLSALQPIISKRNSWLNDDSLDAFLGVVQENHPVFEVQSMMYLYYLHSVQPAQTKTSVVIIGGTCTKHWRFRYYDGHTVRIYDAIPNYAIGKPVEKEKRYISQRFSGILESKNVCRGGCNCSLRIFCSQITSLERCTRFHRAMALYNCVLEKKLTGRNEDEKSELPSVDSETSPHPTYNATFEVRRGKLQNRINGSGKSCLCKSRNCYSEEITNDADMSFAPANKRRLAHRSKEISLASHHCSLAARNRDPELGKSTS